MRFARGYQLIGTDVFAKYPAADTNLMLGMPGVANYSSYSFLEILKMSQSKTICQRDQRDAQNCIS